VTFKDLHDKLVAFDTELGGYMKQLCEAYPLQTRPAGIRRALEAGERARLSLHDTIEWLTSAFKRVVES